MGSAEGAKKAREIQIEKYGSYEKYRAALRTRASKGGKTGESGYSTMSKEDRKRYGSMGGKKRNADSTTL